MLTQVVCIAYTLLMVYTTLQLVNFLLQFWTKHPPDPLGLRSFTWGVPKGASFAKYHHCREEQHFSISGHKPIKIVSHLTIRVRMYYMNYSYMVYSAYIRPSNLGHGSLQCTYILRAEGSGNIHCSLLLALVLRLHIQGIHHVTTIYMLHIHQMCTIHTSNKHMT